MAHQSSWFLTVLLLMVTPDALRSNPSVLCPRSSTSPAELSTVTLEMTVVSEVPMEMACAGELRTVKSSKVPYPFSLCGIIDE